MKHQTLSIKHYFIFILSVFAFQSAFAQQYTFEDEVPTDFTVSGGSLSITPDHYKDGTHSLRWEAEGVSTFTIKGFATFKTTSSDATVFQLYLPAITNDTLTMECLLADGTVKRTATILCNYRGWREINRLYKEYSSTSAFQMAQLRFTLHPASAGKRYLCFDAMNLNAATDANRVPGCMWVLDYSYLKTNNTPLTFYLNRPNIPITTPTAQELADLEIVRSRVRPEMSYNAMQAIVAKNWVKNNIQLVRNEDGTIHSTIIDNSGTALKAATLKSTMERLQYLAGGKIKGDNQEIVDAFDTYLEVLMDQGLADGCNITYASNSYGDPRAIIPIMLNVLIACDSAQAEEWVKVGKWVSQYYCMYYSDENFAYNQNSDIVYVFTLYHQVLAAFHPNKAEAVRELKAMKRFVDRMSTYVEGPKELLKPDGCGFHHNVFYLGYMYSYNTFTTALSNLRGTCFQIGEDGYRRFSKALITEYRILTPSTTDARHYALTLAGRHPFGTTSSYNNSLWKLLIDAGADYPQAQQELQSAYNYFYQNKQYDAPEVSYEGYVECNWSPIGVMRHKNWVAVMHAPTTKFWGSEIYTATNGGNRLGRYQGHGALNICYSGTNMLASGYPTNSTGGGWDWNVNPGTTTVHYTNWTEMLPNKNTTQRFDQYTKSTNFSGACGLDQCGVWASNFDQTDSQGSTVCFEATNLMFHKSVFCFDSLFVALGTDISSIGNYANDRITATNLDQAVVGNGLLKKKFYVDGEERELGYADTLDNQQAHTLVMPTSTGYYIPAGNDVIQVYYQPQITPVLEGTDTENPKTELNVAKAYINHNVKPVDKTYQYVVVPAQTNESMQTLATQWNKQLPYKVLYQTSALHAVQWGNTTGYAFFTKNEELTEGIIKSVDHQHLWIQRFDSLTGCYSVAACNPNLEPKTDANFKWVSSPTSTTNVLRGDYELVGSPEGVTCVSTQEGLTTIDIDFNQGLPVHFTLKDKNYVPPFDALPSVNDRPTACHKVLRKGQMMIVKNHQIYSVLGQRL